MDFDNPSYFNVPDERKRMGDSCSSASECSLTRQLTPPRGKSFCRDKRNFLRSMSSNSADSNQELLIMGEPRLSDIAPDIVFKNPSSRSNSLKQNKVNSNGDVGYIPLATSEEQADASEDEEVFISEDSARYYNFPAVKRNGQRRHSISTFVGRERTNSVASSSKSFKEDFPQRENEENIDIDEHSLRHASYPRKRCLRCTRGVTKGINMDDILILSRKSSEAASLWVNYFTNYFQQISQQATRKQFKIQYRGVEDTLDKSDEIRELPKKMSGVKLQLVVICPSFLEFVAEHPGECAAMGKLLLADRTLALLLGVTDNDLTEVHKNVLPTYFQWQRQSVGQDQDENFTKEFLGQAMAILSRVWKQQSSVIAQEKSCFSVTPKKIRQGQNSVFVILTHPLQKEDIVKISVEKNGELYEVKSVKKRNPYILKFTMPENLTEVTAIVNILVEKNGSIIGSRPIKCESKLRELEQILRSTANPVEFMCQALGFSPAERELLDNWLVHRLQNNIPPHFNLISRSESIESADVPGRKHTHEEFPTLLHFAAKFGLHQLARLLLDTPGGDQACEIKNLYDMTPLELAESNGFSNLAHMFRGYIDLNEFTNIYTKLEEITRRTLDDGYEIPRNIKEDIYKICPAPRPVTTPTSESSSLSGYMPMKPVPVLRQELPKATDDCHVDLPTIQEQVYQRLVSKNRQKVDDLEGEDKVQKELVEIINDFKNHIHSIDQAEELVRKWQSRNDVQMSFKEKQEQLMEMRMRYDQLQSMTRMKHPSFFDKMKRVFSKTKHEKPKVENITTTSISQSVPSLTIVHVQRPISSLSTSSSGSSGRSSRMSESSFGDSGTHSDNEGRKLIMGSHPDEDCRTKLLADRNYDMVPVPKPVTIFKTIQEKPLPHLDNSQLNDEFYSKFSPSSQPVSGLASFEQKGQLAKNDYMNVNSSEL
nr:uncharacterized protein LOC111505611 [Leptinotarsa decemlineata]